MFFRKPQGKTRTTANVVALAGAMCIAGGIAAWSLVTQQLRAEKIVIPSNAVAFQGKRVTGPATAYVEALVIKSNAERGTGGRTFADISEELRTVEKGSEEQRSLFAHSSSLSTAAALRTSLMTSVLAYGVSAFVAGVGVVFALVGKQLRNTSR